MDGTLLNKKYKLDERITALNEEATSLDGRVTALEEGGGGGLPDYSTDEQAIGRKWIDGRDIYVKTFNVGALPSSGNVTIQNDIVNFAAVINTETVGISSDGYSFSNGGLVMSYANSTSLVFRITFDATGYNGYVTVYYVKNESQTKKRITKKKTEE